MSYRHPHRPVPLCALALIAAACGTATLDQAPTVCTGPGGFVPCPGSKACVDPLSGSVIPCPSGDVSFGKGDGSDAGGDAKAGDGSDGGPADASGDAAKAETGTGETLQGDGGSGDAGVADAGVGDAGPCQTGQKTCKDKATLQTCTAGVWGGSFTCPSNQECNDGACGCPSPCKAIGLVECLPDVAALKTCQLNPDKCLSWGVPIACKPGEVCEAGICKATSGGCTPACKSGETCQGKTCVPTASGGSLSCSQIVACTGNCAAGDATCSDDCVAKGSSSGQTALSNYKTCIGAVCKPLADAGKVNAAMACIFGNCFDVQSACLGSGSATCSQVNACMGGCASSASCVDGCNKSASKAGGTAYYTLYACIDDNCPGQSGDALIDCAKTACTAGFIGCFSPSGGQTLFSCLEIANCQKKCGGEVLCAKACTQQGTPQAQADVNAFIDCRDNTCGAYCPGADCSLCLAQYCAAELSACSQ